ncbi:hypothetical protein [Priestia abyssalis]|uniref:hypothetical protein n=1 Tax=Priestia abyssalis TaxID=1221450 RepID=UPI0014751FBE|nr:hypothetical protein [Priestia abyssalis]
MMDYQYRLIAYKLAAEQRDEIIAECKKNYEKKKQDKFYYFLKRTVVNITSFFQHFH